MALSVKVGQFNAATSLGNQAINTVGFQPKLVLFWGESTTAVGYSATPRFFLGAAASATQRWAFGWVDDDAAATINSGRLGSSALCINIPAAGTPTKDATADFVTMDATGFTINWTDAPSSAWKINYVAYGGTDITNVKLGTFSLATTGASQGFTDPGFRPDFLMVAHVGGIGDAASAHLYLGAASSVNDQAALMCLSQDGNTDSRCAIWQKSGRIVLNSSSAGVADAEAALSSFDSTGFTLSVPDLPASATTMAYIAVQGGAWKVGTATQNTATGAKATATAGVTPQVVLLFGVNATSNASLNTAANAALSFGAGDGTNEFATWHESVDNLGTSNTNRAQVDDKAIRHASSDTTTNAEADLSVVAGGFSLNWTTADATAREFIYVAAGQPTKSFPDRRGRSMQHLLVR